jgi:hypothetical protein
MSSFPGVRRPEHEAGQNYIYFEVKECVKLYFIIPLYIAMVLRAKYLNGRGSGYPTYRTLQPGKVLNAIPYKGCMDSEAYCISPVTIIRNRKHVTPTLWILYTCGSEV